MKFTCTKENLIRAITVVNNIAGKQTNLPILSNVLFRVEQAKVEVIATNLEIAVKTIIRAKIEKEGAFTVPAKIVSDYISFIDGDQITLEQSGSELLITSGGTATRMKGLPADEYPVIPFVDQGNEYRVLVAPFRESLSNVVFAASKQDIRPELSGVYLSCLAERYKEGMILASTDSYRLAEKKVSIISGETPFQVIIPSRTVQEMIRLLSTIKQEQEEALTLRFAGTQMCMLYGDVELVSRLIDGDYPDYVQIIPQEHKTVAVISKEQLVKHIKAASIFSTSGMNGILFDINPSDGSFVLKASSQQSGEYVSDIPAELRGESNMVVLNYRYVLDGIQQMEGDIEVRVNNNESPSMFSTRGNAGYVYIVMPIRQ